MPIEPRVSPIVDAGRFLVEYLSPRDEDEDRPIDQIHCTGCGRPMVVWADEPIQHYECGRCRRGLSPEWEF